MTMTIKATIEHSDGPDKGRVQLTLIEDNGRYVWQAQAEGEDAYLTDVTGDTEEKAVEAAGMAWYGVWDLQFEDEESEATAWHAKKQAEWDELTDEEVILPEGPEV